jgi:hypothetical protein
MDCIEQWMASDDGLQWIMDGITSIGSWTTLDHGLPWNMDCIEQWMASDHGLH